MWVDLDAEEQRAQRYSDLSRSAFVIGALALAVVAGIAIFLFSTDIVYRG